MNKKPLIIACIIILAILSGGAYLAMSNKDDKAKDQMIEKTNVQLQPEKPASNEPAQTAKPGSYVVYAADVIANTSGTKLLFFHAPWCPQCRALEADIKSKGVPSGVSIIKVDYDTHQDLREKYGVTLQTTVVKIDDSGNLVKKFVAYDDPSLAAIESSLL